jgi:hypothetical protein
VRQTSGRTRRTRGKELRVQCTIEAPLGYANVRAHALFHRDYLRKQQAVVLGASTSNSPQMNTDKRI